LSAQARSTFFGGQQRSAELLQLPHLYLLVKPQVELRQMHWTISTTSAYLPYITVRYREGEVLSGSAPDIQDPRGYSIELIAKPLV